MNAMYNGCKPADDYERGETYLHLRRQRAVEHRPKESKTFMVALFDLIRYDYEPCDKWHAQVVLTFVQAHSTSETQTILM